MVRSATARILADRLCRPQRVGVFGHRGVGKTTLLTMLYREAVGGRLPGLRLAAADARTAEYLAEKIVQLEAGKTLPATLAETDLSFHLYKGECRVEVLLKDYQGEHVELGRTEPIRAFLKDCDAVWLCLDPATSDDPAGSLRRQQEVEQLMEDTLGEAEASKLDRPFALILMKSDLLTPAQLEDVDGLACSSYGMTRHSLQTHCMESKTFCVSSLGIDRQDTQEATVPRVPINLDQPLLWLLESLQTQDEARLEKLWATAGSDVGLLQRCVACFARRYPEAAATAQYQQRLRGLQKQRRRQRTLAVAAAAACLLIGLFAYDALGYQSASRFEKDHPDDPAAALQSWQQYQRWHPTRHLLAVSHSEAETARLVDLAANARQQERETRLAELRRLTADPDADVAKLWSSFQDFRAAYPEATVEQELRDLRTCLAQRRDEDQARQAKTAHDELQRALQQGGDLKTLLTKTDRFLREHPASAHDADVRRCRAGIVQRMDEQDIQAARDYSSRQPLNFQSRLDNYQGYLDKHSTGGNFTDEARKAIATIGTDWDRHDFRRIRDLYVAHPAEVAELALLCRRYRAVHPQGRFVKAADELLRWTERVTAVQDYRVTLQSGQFEKNVARFFSRGPKLSVELEVNGVRHGPSTIVYNRYDPEWSFEYPRPIRWKLGQPIRIWVTEHSWKDSIVMDVSSADGDALALKMLSGEVWSGANRLTFASTFQMPQLPTIE